MDICHFKDYGLVNRGALPVILKNRSTRLTVKQKDFAVSCAMKTVGTTEYEEAKEKLAKKIRAARDARPRRIFRSVFYRNYVDSSNLRDIRYLILRNSSWSKEEKEKLIQDFWVSDDDFDEAIDNWETHAIIDGYLHEYISNYQFTTDHRLVYCPSEGIAAKSGSKKVARDVSREIRFCDEMHGYRPTQKIPSMCFGDYFYEGFCKKIDDTLLACDLMLDKNKARPIKHGKEETNEERRKYRRAKKYYQQHYDLEVLGRLAEIIAPEYAKLYFSRRVAKQLLVEDGIEDAEIPMSKREHMFSKIFFFAKSLGIIEGTLIDYNTEVLDSDLLRIFGETYGNTSREFYADKLAFIESNKENARVFMKVKTRRAKPKTKEETL